MAEGANSEIPTGENKPKESLNRLAKIREGVRDIGRHLLRKNETNSSTQPQQPAAIESKAPLPSKEIIAANLPVPGFANKLIEDHPEAKNVIDEIKSEQQAETELDRAAEPVLSKEIIAANLPVPGFANKLIEDHPEAKNVIDEIKSEQNK